MQVTIDRTEPRIFDDVYNSGYTNKTYQDVRTFSGHFDNKIEDTFSHVDKMSIVHLTKPGYCFAPDEEAINVYEIIKRNPSITEFSVIENDSAIGFLTRAAFNEKLGGQYGFSLYSKSPIKEIMKTNFLSVDHCMPLDQVSRLAMQRPFERLYNPIIVEKEGKYLGIVTVKDLLDTCTNMALAERDEIALMRDNLKIGLFFMDRNFIIQEKYSRYLEELFSLSGLGGKSFIDLLLSSVSGKELNAIKDYFDMVFNGKLDQSMLEEINPLTELHYKENSCFDKKVFQCGFATINHISSEVYMLVSIYDITARVELQHRLAEEEEKRQEEMKTFYEILQIDPLVFKDFIDDAEYEFEKINRTLKNELMSSNDVLVEIYQSIHAIKSNAVILGLNAFGSKAHKLEHAIKKLREREDDSFTDMLNLTIDIENFSEEKERIKTTINKINSFKLEHSRKPDQILIETLTKTADKAARDMDKKVMFIAEEIESEAVEKCQMRLIKEALIQLIRNSAVHGIETPEERLDKGKDQRGIIRLSIKMKEEKIHIKLSDDGRGLDYSKIAEKALQKNLIKPEDINNKDILLKIIFSPGFSTAENETVHAGRGIGLNLVQDRVREGKGAIKVQTEPGRGTAFHIYFPV